MTHNTESARPGALALAFLTAEVERVDPLFRAGVSGELRGAQKYASEAVADVQALLARCEAAEAALANAEMGIRATSQALAAAKAELLRTQAKLTAVIAERDALKVALNRLVNLSNHPHFIEQDLLPVWPEAVDQGRRALLASGGGK